MRTLGSCLGHNRVVGIDDGDLDSEDGRKGPDIDKKGGICRSKGPWIGDNDGVYDCPKNVGMLLPIGGKRILTTAGTGIESRLGWRIVKKRGKLRLDNKIMFGFLRR